MLEYETKAVVLDKKTIGEFDAQIVLYTELMGKIELIAKGLKKPTAKLSHHLEPLNLINTTLIAVNHKHLTSALTVNRFPDLRRNPEALTIALKNLKILKEAVVSPEKDELLWRNLTDFLENLEKFSRNENALFIQAAGLHFLLQLAQRLGVLPDSFEDWPFKTDAKVQKIVVQLLSCDSPEKIDLKIFEGIKYSQVEEPLKKIIITSSI